MRRLVRLYPAAWRERYGDEMEVLLEEHPLGPFDLVDLLLGALDAHLHLRGLGHPSEHKKGFTMSLRIAGYAALVTGALWIALGVFIAFDGNSNSDETPVVGLFIGFLSALTLLVALAGLSRNQAQRHRVLVWLSVAFPAFGALVFMLAIPFFAIEPSDGVSSGLGWTLFVVSWFSIPIGTILFGLSTLWTGAFSRGAGLALVAGPALMVCLFVLTMASEWESNVGQLASLIGVAGFGISWIPIGLEAVRRDRTTLLVGTSAS